MSSTDTQFKKGNKAGKGRKKGSRNKITKKYFDTLDIAWDPDVIEEIKKDRPDVYIKLYSQLVPKDLDINHSGNISISVVDYSEDDE